jgi:hypothetical protein
MRPITALLALAATLPAAEVALPVTGVTLYATGVGRFEHGATVDGQAVAELRLRAAQMDDVLKSLVLQDLDGGRVGAVNYPSQEPLERTLRAFQVDLSGDPPLAGILTQMRGAVVRVRVLDSDVTGTILGCEARTRGGGQTPAETHWVLTLVVDGAITPVRLDDVGAIQPADLRLRAELGQALAAVAAARDQDRRPLSLRFDGQGQRRVRVAYVAETPVWKTSYRLLLRDGNAHLQAWAVVENTTEADWTDVRLALVGGQPVSFIQQLYQPRYQQRPRVEAEALAMVRPGQYAGDTLGERSGGGRANRDAESQDKRVASRGLGQNAAAFAFAPQPAAGADVFEAADSISVATERTQEVGELFSYDVGAVTIPRQGSALIPFIGLDVPVERIAVYDAAAFAKHPLSGVRFANRTGQFLPGGPLTVYEAGAYAGDARLASCPAGQERLLTYAVDARVAVDDQPSASGHRRTLAAIAQGVLRVQVASTQGRTYIISNAADAPRTVVVTHPRTGGTWSLHDTQAPRETTDSHYRFDVAVPPGGQTTLRVLERRIDQEMLSLADDPNEQTTLLLEDPDLSPALRRALAGVQEHLVAMRAARTARDDLRVQEGGIVTDQDRIRDNLGRVNQGTDYAKRLLAKLNDQETALDALRLRIDQAEADLRTRQAALAAAVAGLTVE